jgi:hypothetical protein
MLGVAWKRAVSSSCRLSLWLVRSRLEAKVNREAETSGNVLPPGITLDQIEEAVTHSGYPLQTATSELLKEQFRVLPEWGYRDRITGDLRTLDILAIDTLAPQGSKEDSKVHPFLALLIECKQSLLPYVFFSEPVALNTSSARIPRICGLPSKEMVILTDDSRYAYPIPLLRALGVYKTPFLQDAPRCSVFSKCVRKGKGIELSGTEAYSGIVMPMMSAMEHFEKASAPRNTTAPRSVFMVLAVAVVDAPMIAYDISQDADKVKFVPWHRVIRNEPNEEDGGFLGRVGSHMGSQSAVDVVHKDFLGDYLTKYVRPFAKDFADLLLRHDEAFARGQIFVKGYGADQVSDLWSRADRE